MSAEVNPRAPGRSVLRVAIDAPRIAHSQLSETQSPHESLFDYRWAGAAAIGQRVLVPWARTKVIGIIVEISDHSLLPDDKLRDAISVLDDVAPLSKSWFRLIQFAANYYQRGIGEVALPALPTLLRRADGYREKNGVLRSRSIDALRKRVAHAPIGPDGADSAGVHRSHHPADASQAAPTLNEEQRAAVSAVSAAIDAEGQFSSLLLFGVTGSGKTEVYLAAIARVLAGGGQVLVLVPEINLTPQLEGIFRRRFANARLATLNSSMPDGERAANWLAAHEGHADILLATRMGVLASLTRLRLIVVDEEHDPSFKQQEGLRYSARDLAVVRAQQEAIPVVLGSATPSIESWWQAERGRYRRLTLTRRAGSDTHLPAVHLISTERVNLEHGFTPQLRAALGERLERGEQSLIFLNRRGYAPVIACGACAWVSDCTRCSAHAVYHRADGRIHCHHCGWQSRVPRACPDCGNQDLAPLGRGTQRVEENLAAWYPHARVVRIDRDSTRRRGSARSLFDAVHAGDVDILIGTQMVAKGHDFRNLTLVGVLEADGALYSQNFRAAERLFANLMQVAGRAGRADKPGEVLIQTRFADHGLFRALASHDYPRFAEEELAERRAANLPPISHQAILRAEARKIEDALAFINAAREGWHDRASEEGVQLFDAVPMTLVRLANVERAQLLIEAASRPALQNFLAQWIGQLARERTRISWHIEVDPIEI